MAGAVQGVGLEEDQQALVEWLAIPTFPGHEVEAACVEALRMHWPMPVAAGVVRSIGIRSLVIQRQVLGPPYAARAVVMSLRQNNTLQDPTTIVPTMHPISLTFNSEPAESSFRATHARDTSRRRAGLDVAFAIAYFALLVPCLGAWGMDADPSAPVTLPYRVTSLASSAFVLLGVGPLVVLAAQLSWAATHTIVLRAVTRVLRVASVHLVQVPVPPHAPCAGAAAWCAAVASRPADGPLFAFPLGVVLAVGLAVVAEAPLVVDRVAGDVAMAPLLMGLPLWGCSYALLRLMLPSVRPAMYAVSYCLIGWLVPAAVLWRQEALARARFLGVLWAQRV